MVCYCTDIWYTSILKNCLCSVVYLSMPSHIPLVRYIWLETWNLCLLALCSGCLVDWIVNNRLAVFMSVIHLEKTQPEILFFFLNSCRHVSCWKGSFKIYIHVGLQLLYIFFILALPWSECPFCRIMFSCCVK